MRWWTKEKEEDELYKIKPTKKKLSTYQEILNEKPYQSIIPSKDNMENYLTRNYRGMVYQHVNWAIEYLESDLEPVTIMSSPLAIYEHTLRLACAKYLEDNPNEN